MKPSAPGELRNKTQFITRHSEHWWDAMKQQTGKWQIHTQYTAHKKAGYLQVWYTQGSNKEGKHRRAGDGADDQGEEG